MWWGSNYHLCFTEQSFYHWTATTHRLLGFRTSSSALLSLLCLSPFLHISTKADQISEQLKTPWTSKSLNQDLLFLFFPFQKTGQGSRHWLKLAYTGTCWPTLAREWYRLNGCQVIEDCQSNFKWPLSPSLLLFHTPLPSIYSPTAIVCFS